MEGGSIRSLLFREIQIGEEMTCFLLVSKQMGGRSPISNVCVFLCEEEEAVYLGLGLLLGVPISVYLGLGL